MKKIGLFYATKAERTSWVAEKIQKEFGEDKIEVVAIEQACMGHRTKRILRIE